MRVVCIDNSRIITGYNHLLVVGKEYEVINLDRSSFFIICEDGEERPFKKNRFELLSDIRDRKLNILLG